MKMKKIISIFFVFTFIYSCADYNVNKNRNIKEKNFYSSKGFALVYEDNLYTQKLINKKINNQEIQIMHDILKANTHVQILNPKNSKFVKGKVNKKGNYPKIFNVVISKKIASILELDTENPYVEVFEVKKNKTFIAKKANTFEEEKNVATKAPIDQVLIDDLTSSNTAISKKKVQNNNFILVINDFYYQNSAIDLKNELSSKTNMKNIKIKKINDNKYRLFVGPFKNFNALKTAYISLNNLGFDELNVYKE